MALNDRDYAELLRHTRAALAKYNLTDLDQDPPAETPSDFRDDRHRLIVLLKSILESAWIGSTKQVGETLNRLNQSVGAAEDSDAPITGIDLWFTEGDAGLYDLLSIELEGSPERDSIVDEIQSIIKSLDDSSNEAVQSDQH